MAAKIKSDPQTERIPIIFLTARGTEEDTVRGLELGADDYISKPFSLKEVLARQGGSASGERDGAPFGKQWNRHSGRKEESAG